jgi:hypothetical protein
MAAIPPRDRVAENSTSNSQSIFTVTGAIDVSHKAFSAFMSIGDTTIGGVVEAGVAYKTGILTYSASNEVTVTTVKDSNGTFSSGGTKEVFMGLPALSTLLVDLAQSLTSAQQTQAANNLLTPTGAAAQSLTATQKNQIQQNIGVPGQNYLMNPSGEISQRGLGSKTDVLYDFDRWNTLVQTAAVTVSQLTNVENTTPFMMRSLQAQASAQRFGRIQWIENKKCIDLRGQAVVLSARVRMSASTTLRYAIVEWTGTADSITKDVVNDWTSGTFTTGNFFTSTTTTLVAAGSIALTANTLTDITALTGTISGSMNNLAVIFWTDSTQAQNVTLDIGKVKLETGSLATPFARPDWQLMLEECEAYFWKTFPYATAPAQNAGTTGALQADSLAAGITLFSSLLPRRMFKAGSITTYNPSAANASVRDATNSADRAVGSSSASENSFTVEFTSASPPCRNFVHVSIDADL